MTKEEQFEMLCTAQFEILDIYDKHCEELAAQGAPETLFALICKRCKWAMDQNKAWAHKA